MPEPDQTPEPFGAFLLAQRKLANISQRQLAKASGVSDSYLSQVERGMYRPSAEVVKSLARAFGLPTSRLYQQMGLLDAEPDKTTAASVPHALRHDPKLTEDQKSALLAVYRAFVNAPAQSAAQGA